MDLLGEDLSGLQLGGPSPQQQQQQQQAAGGLGDLFSLASGPGLGGSMYSPPKTVSTVIITLSHDHCHSPLTLESFS